MEVKDGSPNAVEAATPSTETLAFHEAGHAVVGVAFGVPLHEISIESATSAYCDWRQINRDGAPYLLAVISAGGPCVEARRRGESPTQVFASTTVRPIGWNVDYAFVKHAAELAGGPLEEGMRAFAIVGAAITARWAGAVDALAAALMRSPKLPGDTVRDIVTRHAPDV